jgi:hypothetical protein
MHVLPDFAERNFFTKLLQEFILSIAPVIMFFQPSIEIIRNALCKVKCLVTGKIKRFKLIAVVIR